MSWTLYNIKGPVEDVSKLIDAAILEQAPNVQKTIKKASRQVEQVKLAAVLLAEGVTRPGDHVIINIVGHYNQDCNPDPNWADCTLTVGVSQIPKEKL